MFLKNTFENRRSVFFSWLISYVSILLIPVLISGIIYFVSVRIIKNEINRTNSAMLRLVQQDIDSKLKEVDDLSRQISNDPKVDQILYAKLPLQTYESYNILQIVNEFTNYSNLNQNIYYFYVFLRNSGLIIGKSAMYDLNILFDRVHQYQKITFDEFDTLLKAKHTKDYIPLEIIDNFGNIRKVIAYAQSIPIGVNEEPLGNIMILIDEEQLKGILQNLNWMDRGEVMVVDDNNQVISSNTSVSLTNDIRYDKFVKPGEIHYEEYKSQKVIVSYVQSKICKWKYVSITPVSVYMEKVQYVQRLTYFGIVMFILVGGFVAYFFSKKNYHPINEMVQVIAKTAGIAINRGYNEYRFIQDALNSTIAEKEEVNVKIKKQNIMLQSNFIYRLLKGRIDSGISFKEASSSYELKFISESFAVMLFYIEDFEKLNTDKDQENLKLVQFIIGNVVEELVRKSHYGITTEIDEMLSCLVSVNETKISNSKAELSEIARETQNFLKERFNVFLSISISNLHQNMGGISKAYQEALEAMEYRMLMGSEKIICFDDIKKSQKSYYYPIEIEYQLINYIKVGDFEKASHLLNEVFEKNFSNEGLPIQIAKCLLFNLTGTMIKATSETVGVGEDSFVQQLDPINRLLECKSVQGMKEQMIQILKGISEYIARNKKSHNSNLKDELLEYIEQNYNNPDLSITLIADRFDMHPVYISSFCKEQTGMSLLDYINKVRVNKSKQLLNDKKRKLNISETALKVGYSDTRSLIRMFKKYEGITPGQYKKSTE